jgi:hypothetical protein
MKSPLVPISFIALALSAFGSDRVVRIIEASPPGSPVGNNGSVTFAEMVSGDRVLSAFSQNWTVKNFSPKSIVALVETLVIQYPSGNRAGPVQEYELFFHPDLLKPGDEVSFSRPARDVTEFGSHGSGPGEPNCTVNVLWVQFADGSTFGDRKYADSLLRKRRATLDGLRRLRDIYLNQGAATFASELRKKVEPTVDSNLDMFVEQLSSAYLQTNDVQATYNKLQNWLDTADSRKSLLE